MNQVVNQTQFQYICSTHSQVTRIPESSVLFSSDQQKQEVSKKNMFNEQLNQISDEVCQKCQQFKYIINMTNKNLFTCACEQQVSKMIDKNIFRPGRSVNANQSAASDYKTNTLFHISKKPHQSQTQYH